MEGVPQIQFVFTGVLFKRVPFKYMAELLFVCFDFWVWVSLKKKKKVKLYTSAHQTVELQVHPIAMQSYKPAPVPIAFSK